MFTECITNCLIASKGTFTKNSNTEKVTKVMLVSVANLIVFWLDGMESEAFYQLHYSYVPFTKSAIKSFLVLDTS